MSRILAYLSTPAVLTATALPTPAAAHTICLSSTSQNPDTFALGVPVQSTAIDVHGFELYTRRIGGPLTIQSHLLLADNNGKPVQPPVHSGTMNVVAAPRSEGQLPARHLFDREQPGMDPVERW